MRRLAREQAAELFGQYWAEMEKEWFKLEVLQDYTPEDNGPSLRNWLKGDYKRGRELLKKDPDPEFSQRCREKAALGVKLLRIHVLSRPLTPYMRWELEFYKLISRPLRNERVFVVYKSQVADLELPAGDLMIFDGRRAVLNEYQNGRLTHQTFYGEDDDLRPFLKLRRALKSRAKPL